MADVDSYPLTVKQNADQAAIVFTKYTNYEAGTKFDFTGYSASMMIRVSASDVSPVLTLTPTLGGSAGTLSISWTATQANTLASSLPNLVGVYDVMLTSGGGTQTYFIGLSPITVILAVTR